VTGFFQIPGSATRPAVPDEEAGSLTIGKQCSPYQPGV
jgi:hypothetical protein